VGHPRNLVPITMRERRRVGETSLGDRIPMTLMGLLFVGLLETLVYDRRRR